MKVIILAMFLSLSAHASTLSLFCEKSESAESCAGLAEAALLSLGCTLDRSETVCARSSGSYYCDLKSSNCSRALPGNFGGETCYDSQKLEYSKSFRVHNGYWLGIFGSYSRTVCRSQ